jgi:hypothetical protein
MGCPPDRLLAATELAQIMENSPSSVRDQKLINGFIAESLERRATKRSNNAAIHWTAVARTQFVSRKT